MCRLIIKVLRLTLSYTLKWNDNFNELVAKASKGIEGRGSPLWWPRYLCIDTLSSGILLCHVVKQPTCLSKPRSSKPRKKAIAYLISYTHYNDAPSVCKINPAWGSSRWPVLYGVAQHRDHPRNHACFAYGLPCVLRASLTICTVATTQSYQSVVGKDIKVAFPSLSLINSPFNPAPVLL